MKFTTPRLLMRLTIGLVMALAACSPKPQPSIGFATVNATHASLRSRNLATSRTLKVLEPGERVELLEQQDRWFRVRVGEIEGWMEISTILTDEVRAKMQEAVAASQGQTAQNSGVLKDDANLRLEPGRNTSVMRRLAARTRVDILERRTIAREDLKDRTEPWLKVRTSNDVGWLLSSFVEFDVPVEIEQYTEDFVYATVKTVNEVQDPNVGTVRWYVVGERRPGTNADIDFTGVRVFTWNSSRQRYETAFRNRDLRGVYPLEVGRDGTGKPTFRIHELSPDGTGLVVRNFEMNGVVVREIRKRTG